MNIGDLVLYKNNQLIALNKPAGVGVQADRTGDKALIDLAEIYCKSKLYLPHRIDRPASGVVLFTKNKNALAILNEAFRGSEVKKTYLAVVKNAPDSPNGTLVHFLKKNGRTNRSKAFEIKQPNTKKAILHYRTLDSSDHYHLLEIQLETGRHHQIRTQLAAIDCPIKGDVKYGFRRNNPDRSIHLHAWKLEFKHPVSEEKEEIIAPLPTDDVIWQVFQEKMLTKLA